MIENYFFYHFISYIKKVFKIKKLQNIILDDENNNSNKNLSMS